MRNLPGSLIVVLALCGTTGCSLVGLGRIQPQHVEGAWTFRPASGSRTCGIDSLAVGLGDGDRTWGAFFVSGDARPDADADADPAPALQITHGRVHPDSGAFKLVFSDHPSPPRRTRQFALEGSFDESGGASGNYVRSLPGPECVVRMTGRKAR